MTRFALACGVCLGIFALSGCGDDDSADKSSGVEDGGSSGSGGSHAPPTSSKPHKDAGVMMEDPESEGTVTLGDAGMRLDDCEGADDGSACGPNGGLLCLDGACVPSHCGDGFVDKALEECDDSNTDPGDGCEADCSWTCEDDSMCDDSAACNGKERCLVNHTCELGTQAGDGTTCTSAAVSDGQCRQGTCTPTGCGDKDVKGGEQCDDGNDVTGDGCEIDCTFSCEGDVDCDDGSKCTGVESCDTLSHTCKAGTALECHDTSDCTRDDCDAVEGCIFVLIDDDGDGHAPSTFTCGDDCDDSRADVYPGHPEMCDPVDHDCDPNTAPGGIPPTWYVDCDSDGYAALDAPSKITCDKPEASGCGGTWTTRAPDPQDPTTFDCNDAEIDAFPGQTGWFVDVAEGTSGWEYNCNHMLDRLYTTVGVDPDRSLCSTSIYSKCSGPAGWTTDKPPQCGELGQYTRCSLVFGHTIDGTACQRTVYDLQEECR